MNRIYHFKLDFVCLSWISSIFFSNIVDHGMHMMLSTTKIFVHMLVVFAVQKVDMMLLAADFLL